MDTADGICVVTHPLAGAGENATRTLLDLLSAIAPVSLVTADLPADSTVRDDHEVVELTDKGAGTSILVEPRGDVPLTLRLHWEQRVPAPVARSLAGSVWHLERACFAVSDVCDYVQAQRSPTVGGSPLTTPTSIRTVSRLEALKTAGLESTERPRAR